MLSAVERGLIFDCDGVIIDTEPAWDESNRIFLARRGATYERDVHKPLLTGRSAAEGAQALQSLFGFRGDPLVLAEERRALLRDHLETVPFIPGFDEFFAWARGQFGVAVATAMDQSMFDYIDAHLGLNEMFDANVVVSSDATPSKPEPDLFLLAAGRLGLDPSSCIVIEDAPLGIEAARRAGMACIALATTYPSSYLTEATVVATDWAAVRTAVGTLIEVPAVPH